MLLTGGYMVSNYWQGASWLFPSTFGIRAFVRVNSMGASVSQVLPELRILWIQAAAYLGMACLVYRHQFFVSKALINHTVFYPSIRHLCPICHMLSVLRGDG